MAIFRNSVSTDNSNRFCLACPCSTLSSPIEPLPFLSPVTLDVMGGGFVGSVPTELGVLLRLRRLDLSRNELVGTIPSALGDLSRLGTYVNRLCNVVACFTCSLSHWFIILYNNAQRKSSCRIIFCKEKYPPRFVPFALLASMTFVWIATHLWSAKLHSAALSATEWTTLGVK